MKLMMVMAVGLCAAVGQVGDKAAETKTDSDDAKAILKKSAAAVKKVKTVRYQADYLATAWIIPFVPKVKGKVLMGQQSESENNRFRCDVKLQMPNSDEVQELTAGCDGDLYFLLDPVSKMAYEDIDPAVMGRHDRNVQRVLMPVFGAPEPFKDELEAESVELKETVTIEGEPCYEIHVPKEAPPSLIWYVSKKDLLPRRVVRVYPSREDPKGEDGTTQLTIFKLEVNPKLDKDPFKLHVPEGFTKTEDFAP